MAIGKTSLRKIGPLWQLRLCHTTAMGVVERFSARLAPGDDPAPLILSALQAIERITAAADLPSALDLKLALIVEELVSNVLRHGGCGHPVSLELVLSVVDDGVKLDLVDDGIAFDPTVDRAFAGPDPQSGGGVGLALVRAWSRDMVYCREPGANRLSLTIPGPG